MPDFSDKKFDYGSILLKMLNSVPSNLDKREGSVIWNTLAPNAMILAQIYDIMKANQDNQYADTADRDSLIRLCKTRGITPYPAESTIAVGLFTGSFYKTYNPTSGDTFYVQDTGIVFKANKKIEDGKWEMICTEPGEQGNVNGTLIPIGPTDSSFTGGRIQSILKYGTNEESTEDLRKRYVKSFDVKPYAGNRAFYREYTETIPGVGGAKIYRAYLGKGGHVGVCITDTTNSPPSQELIASVQKALDPTYAHGEGVGVAPIDHIVTVFGAASKTINVSLKLVCKAGIKWDDVSNAVKQKITEYLNSEASTWADVQYITIRNSKLQAKLLEIPEIFDISECLINGVAESVQLSDKEIPKIGTVTGAVI